WVETSPGRMDGLSRDQLDEWQARYEQVDALVPPFPRLDRLPESELRLWRHRLDSFLRRVDLVGELYRTGVVLLMGSGGGRRPGPINDLGHGIQLHIKAGVPVLDAIASATSVAAKWIRIDNVTGSLVKGLEADIIAIDGDPTQDATSLSRVDFVM